MIFIVLSQEMRDPPPPPPPPTHTHFFKFENHLWNNKYVIALITGHDHPATRPTIDHPLGRYKGFEV